MSILNPITLSECTVLIGNYDCGMAVSVHVKMYMCMKHLESQPMD